MLLPNCSFEHGVAGFIELTWVLVLHVKDAHTDELTYMATSKRNDYYNSLAEYWMNFSNYTISNC